MDQDLGETYRVVGGKRGVLAAGGAADSCALGGREIYVRKPGAGDHQSRLDWCSRRSSTCCVRAASGRRCPRSASAAQAPSTSDFLSGRPRESSRLFGRRAWPNTTRCRAFAWRWQSIDGAMMKAPLAQEAVGPNPTDRGKKRKQAAPVGGRPWRPVVARRDRGQRP